MVGRLEPEMKERLFGGGREGVGSEGVQQVVAAPGDLARDREGRAGVGEPAGAEGGVVVVVGSLSAGGVLRGFVGPSERWRRLAG